MYIYKLFCASVYLPFTNSDIIPSVMKESTNM